MGTRLPAVRWPTLAMLLHLAGCVGRGPEMVPVSGTVKLTDGTVPQGKVAIVRFEPLADSDAQPNKGASGDIRPDGHFDLMTVQPGDGAIPGRYKVCFTVYKTYLGQEPLIPDKYAKAQTTPFEVDVESGKSNEFEFELDAR